MPTNFNDLWNDSDFITAAQKEEIDKEVALIGEIVKSEKQQQLKDIKLIKKTKNRMDKF